MIWNLNQTLMKGLGGAWMPWTYLQILWCRKFSSQCENLKQFYYLSFPEIVFHDYSKDNLDINHSVHYRRFIGNDKEAAYSCACMGAWISWTYLVYRYCDAGEFFSQWESLISFYYLTSLDIVFHGNLDITHSVH